LAQPNNLHENAASSQKDLYRVTMDDLEWYCLMAIPNQVVLATDFSPASTIAVSIVSRLARTLKAKVTLLHIFQYVPKHHYVVPVGWMVEIIRKDVQAKLAETKNILSHAGLETEILVLEDGIAAQQILTFVQTCQSPLLVMGTHARGGIERFLLGSTAEEVLRQASCPVVSVGPHVPPVTENSEGFQRILFATDFSEVSIAAIPLTRALQQATGGYLRILHVAKNHASGAEEESRQFDPLPKGLGVNGVAECVVLHGTNVSQAVMNEAERYPADLVILGVRRASAFASHASPKIAFQIIAASPCAVLTISS
jgi:nucleotide-binding universal stress UspA family protein